LQALDRVVRETPTARATSARGGTRDEKPLDRYRSQRESDRTESIKTAKENVVTVTTPGCATITSGAPTLDLVRDHHEGWQALAVASLGRLLSDAELAAVERLPVGIALDLLFPDLADAARHEAMWALG
jgi:hypothetical protein